jgi:hypothetical protein
MMPPVNQSAHAAQQGARAAYHYYGSEAARATRTRRRGAGCLSSLAGAVFLIAFLVVGLVVAAFIVVTAVEMLRRP